MPLSAVPVDGDGDGGLRNDSADVILSLDMTGTQDAWQLEYGQARSRAVAALGTGNKDLAVQAAKMQFILCPFNDPEYTAASVEFARSILAQADGAPDRAERFERFALYGPNGPDGKAGTDDDGADPLAQVSLGAFRRDERLARQRDDEILALAALAPSWARQWYNTERGYERVNSADFEGGARLFVEALADSAHSKPSPQAQTEDWSARVVTYTMDRAKVGLGVVYKARTGTAYGIEEFVARCVKFVEYGAAGEDGKPGTADDLCAPL